MFRTHWGIREAGGTRARLPQPAAGAYPALTVQPGTVKLEKPTLTQPIECANRMRFREGTIPDIGKTVLELEAGDGGQRHVIRDIKLTTFAKLACQSFLPFVQGPGFQTGK